MTGFYLVQPEQGRMYLLGGSEERHDDTGLLEYSVNSVVAGVEV